MVFFGQLESFENDLQSDHPVHFLRYMNKHPAVAREGLAVEEIYAALISVSTDLFLGDTEISIWWALLQLYGVSHPGLSLREILYSSALAAKQYFDSETIIDENFVSKHHIRNFHAIYQEYTRGKDLASDLNRETGLCSDISSFLNKYTNYNEVVEDLVFSSDDDEDSVTFDLPNEDQILDNLASGTAKTTSYLRKKKRTEETLCDPDFFFKDTKEGSDSSIDTASTDDLDIPHYVPRDCYNLYRDWVSLRSIEY
eukprot:CAMPEP_0115021050 /NCGR_PEP_ID=MMETSP0216-20121206/30622_1 /TAXON_ID=223996 /ORGANISM="Protocruzia adherens, Strain Boccale" /LENGTH=254 /DNA_ID=CAMNT_0002393265 /DNA_START=401 /DNA_END=1165 /DNA_ORIENTATION=+